MFRNGCADSIAQQVRKATAATSVELSLPEFRVIYDDHFVFVWRRLRRLGVRRADMMDVIQRVFLVVHFRREDFEGRSSLKSWIGGICQRVVSDYRRSALFRRELAASTVDPDSLEILDSGPLTIVESRQRADQALAILDKLPAMQREALLLFEIQGMSGDDIAAHLHVSVGTVRSRLRLARQTFRREVKRLSVIEAGEAPASDHR